MLGLAKYADRNLIYYKKQKNQMEAHETKAKSIQFRNHVLQRQKKITIVMNLKELKASCQTLFRGWGGDQENI